MSPEVQAAIISAASDWTLFLCEWLHAGPYPAAAKRKEPEQELRDTFEGVYKSIIKSVASAER
jgi:hypothetical protein